MGAWNYCSCGRGFDRLTIREFLEGDVHCPSCGQEDVRNCYATLEDYLIELLDRVEELERKNNEKNI